MKNVNAMVNFMRKRINNNPMEFADNVDRKDILNYLMRVCCFDAYETSDILCKICSNDNLDSSCKSIFSSIKNLAFSTLNSYASKGNSCFIEQFMACPIEQLQKDLKEAAKKAEKAKHAVYLDDLAAKLTSLNACASNSFEDRLAKKLHENSNLHNVYLLVMTDENNNFACLKVGETKDLDKRFHQIETSQKKQYPNNPYHISESYFWLCEDRSQGLLFEAAFRQYLRRMGGYSMSRSTDFIYGVYDIPSVVKAFKKIIDMLNVI